MNTKNTFWQEYLKRSNDNDSAVSLKECEKIMMDGKRELEEAIAIFRQKKLSQVPLVAEIANWLESLDLPKEYISRYTESLLKLIDLKLLLLINKQGQLAHVK